MIKSLFDIGLIHYLVVALLLFVTGLLGVVICKNIIKVFISIEFMLCAVNINLIAFAHYTDAQNIAGMVFNLFIMAVGTVQLAVLICLFYSVYNYKKSVDTNDFEENKG